MRVIIIFLTIFIGALGMSHKIEKELVIEGVIGKFGNEPKSYLGIKGKKGIFKIENATNLQDLQGERVKVDAVLLKKAIGPGFPSLIKVLKVEKKQ